MTSSAEARNPKTDNPFRELPAVSAVLERLPGFGIAPELRAHIVRQELAAIREGIQRGERPGLDDVLERCRTAMQAIGVSRFDPIINGTGVILHTNLGRAPVSDETAAAMAAAASSYVMLEIDPESNQRGGRMDEISLLFRLLTGAEATLVVNNNAGALLLNLASLTHGRDVLVSRGEAVEIGGGVRIPEVVRQGGSRFVEVGTTNRTYLSDYRSAAGNDTAAFLRVHTSNFRIEGFTSGVETSELGSLARELGILLIEDLGSGALLDTANFGLRHEPTVAETLAAGAAIVTLSGDKLLGGPQAGIIAGRADLVDQIERHPLARALRADKATLAGVAATLRHYVRGDAETAIPIWAMVGATVPQLSQRAEVVRSEAGGQVVLSTASIGGGSLPGETLPSVSLRFTGAHPDEFARLLRTGNPRVFPIVHDDAVFIDFRTIRPEMDRALAGAIEHALARSACE